MTSIYVMGSTYNTTSYGGGEKKQDEKNDPVPLLR